MSRVRLPQEARDQLSQQAIGAAAVAVVTVASYLLVSWLGGHQPVVALTVIAAVIVALSAIVLCITLAHYLVAKRRVSRSPRE